LIAELLWDVQLRTSRLGKALPSADILGIMSSDGFQTSLATMALALSPSCLCDVRSGSISSPVYENAVDGRLENV
jgi:hypothetical protein